MATTAATLGAAQKADNDLQLSQAEGLSKLANPIIGILQVTQDSANTSASHSAQDNLWSKASKEVEGIAKNM